MIQGEVEDHFHLVISVLFVMFGFAHLVVICLVDQQSAFAPTSSQKVWICTVCQQHYFFLFFQNPCPEGEASFLSKLTFWWFTKYVLLLNIVYSIFGTNFHSQSCNSRLQESIRKQRFVVIEPRRSLWNRGSFVRCSVGKTSEKDSQVNCTFSLSFSAAVIAHGRWGPRLETGLGHWSYDCETEK